jgi:DNA-binding NarL/FixJ family response regulator
MNPLEIVLIIIGILVIIISCVLVDRSQTGSKQTVGKSAPYDITLSEEDRIKLTDKINELLTDMSEETIVRTDDTLSSLSNEKIMAVNEFSDQILEKIRKNHEEVVFLYSMLNDKERELKAAVKEIDSSKKKVQEILEIKKDNEKNQAAKGNPKTQTKAPLVDKQMMPGTPMDENSDTSAFNVLNSNKNEEILTLYTQGKSVMEISKLLSLGQGEVKLVIDLFKGKN